MGLRNYVKGLKQRTNSYIIEQTMQQKLNDLTYFSYGFSWKSQSKPNGFSNFGTISWAEYSIL